VTTIAAPEPPRSPVAESAAPAAPAAPDPSPDEALLAREDARRLLEKGAGLDALVAARASVALDPSDAEAWLVLGAAYQLVGNAREARAAFESCARVAKRGRTWECRALL
jgi:Flp pilus assembly protein TadD